MFRLQKICEDEILLYRLINIVVAYLNMACFADILFIGETAQIVAILNLDDKFSLMHWEKNSDNIEKLNIQIFNFCHSPKKIRIR